MNLRTARDYFRTVLAIFRKDLLAELRSRELFAAMVVFALSILFIFNFALELESTLRAGLTGGVIWVILTFAGTLGLNRSMAAEKEHNCLDGLLLAPVDRTAIYLGKLLANWVFMLLMAVVVLPVYSLLYQTNLLLGGMLWIVLAGTFGYAAVGTLLSALAVQTRTRDVLMPVLLFPVMIPLLLAAVRATTGCLQGAPLADTAPWMNLLVVYDLVFLAAAIMLFDFIIEE